VVLIRAVSLNGRPINRDLLARFGEQGGTIGRGENSTLVLPDPERFISRVHATISFQAGGFVITDNSTKNPIVLNGRPMGPGSQARLGNGDRIQLGGYILAVELVAGNAAQPPAVEIAAPRVSKPPQDDPWAALKERDPFADLKPKQPVMAPPVPAVPEPPPPPVVEDARADLLASLQGPQPSIDDVIGPAPAAPGLLAPDPALEAMEQPDGIGIVDPLKALGGARKPMPSPTAPDHGHELLTPYQAPLARPDPALGPRSDVAQPGASASQAPLPDLEVPPLSTAKPPAPQASPVPTGAEDPTLLQALLRGAGIPDSPLLRSVTPETMETIGRLLREAVQGTLDLLRARGLTKSEIRADVTMIMPMDNNPLKFSPTAEAAMVHLLTPHVHGFMPPLRAMKSAYDDLRAHELGVLAGTRAALDEVLGRFAPEELKKRLSDLSVLDSLLPLNRKAKQWDLFVERYQAVAEEAREDFYTAFGKAFRRAYEDQVKKLRADERRG